MEIVRISNTKLFMEYYFTYSVSTGFERLALLLVLVFSAQCFQVVVLVGQRLIVQEKVLSGFASCRSYHVQLWNRDIRLCLDSLRGSTWLLRWVRRQHQLVHFLLLVVEQLILLFSGGLVFTFFVFVHIFPNFIISFQDHNWLFVSLI